jgi:hypothetical protein
VHYVRQDALSEQESDLMTTPHQRAQEAAHNATVDERAAEGRARYVWLKAQRAERRTHDLYEAARLRACDAWDAAYEAARASEEARRVYGNPGHSPSDVICCWPISKAEHLSCGCGCDTPWLAARASEEVVT